MNVCMFMAMSLNGYVAREDGAEDWLSAENWQDFLSNVKNYDNFIIGRETYEVVKKLYADYNFDDVEASCKIIVTRNAGYALPDGYIVAHSPQEALDILKQRGFDGALLTGGGVLNAEFLKASLVDEISVNIQPYVLGAGRRLFAEGEYESFIQLREVKQLSGGRVHALYGVKH